MKCSRCGKELLDTIMVVKSAVSIMKKTEDGGFKEIDNVSDPTCEFLCLDCFDKYADCINSLNEEYSGRYPMDIVEVVDDVQYGDII